MLAVFWDSYGVFSHDRACNIMPGNVQSAYMVMARAKVTTSWYRHIRYTKEFRLVHIVYRSWEHGGRKTVNKSRDDRNFVSNVNWVSRDYAGLDAILNNSASIARNTRPQLCTFLPDRAVDSRPLHFTLWIDNYTSIILKVEVYAVCCQHLRRI